MSTRCAIRGILLLARVLPVAYNEGRTAFFATYQRRLWPCERNAWSREIRPVNWYCRNATAVEIASYEEIKSLSRYPEKKFLIDVRDAKELAETGVIPCSVNIPLAEVKDALCLDNQKFEQKYGKQKPDPEMEIIFSCRSGKRAGEAAETALALGFKSVKNYKGSWLDWAEKEGLSK